MAVDGEDGVAEEGVRQRELGCCGGCGSLGVGLRNTPTWMPRPSLVCAGSMLFPQRRGEMVWRKEGSGCLGAPAGSRGPGAGSAAHCFTLGGSHQHAACRATQASPQCKVAKSCP